MNYTVYRHRGRFISKAKYNALKSRGITVTRKRVKREQTETIEDVNDLFQYDDVNQEDFVDHEYHGTGDTGKAKGK